jgi:hypothetical protein
MRNEGCGRMTATAASRSSAWSASFYAGFTMLTIAESFGVGRLSVHASVLLLAAYLAVEAVRVPAVQRAVGLLLGLAGLAMGAWSGRLPETAIGGAERALQFLVLFGAVACLRLPALASPSMRAVGDHVVRQPPGRRFLAVELGSHLFGAVLNLAGLQFVATVIERNGDPALRRRLAAAVLRGYSAASCWSPLFVSLAVVLTVVPGVGWLDVAPMGLFAAAVLLGVGWLSDRLARARPMPGPESAPVPGRPPGIGAAWLRVGGLFLSLFVPTILLVETVPLSVPIAIGVIGPLYAMLWLGRIRRAGSPGAGSPTAVARSLLAEVRGHFPALRGEVLLFTGASLFGSGLAVAIAGTGASLPLPSGDAAIPAIIVMVVAFGALGLHPVVPMIVIGEAFPPARLGLPADMMAVCLMASWGLATLASPFSALALYIGRMLGVSAWTVAWRWNGAYALGSALAVSAALVLLRRVLEAW